MPPKTDQKDNKADSKPKDAKKDKPQDLGNEEKSDQSCTAFAKALIYIVPIALYIPWAYRMFKGQPCCPEVPKPPPTAGCQPHKHKWPKYPGKGGGSQKGESCGFEEASECGKPRECSEEKGPAEDDCGKKSRQCLDKCLDKCLSRDGAKGKGGRKKEKKRSDDCDDDD